MDTKNQATVGRCKNPTIDQLQNHDQNNLFSSICCQFFLPKNSSHESSGNLIHSFDRSSGTGGSCAIKKWHQESQTGPFKTTHWLGRRARHIPCWAPDKNYPRTLSRTKSSGGICMNMHASMWPRLPCRSTGMDGTILKLKFGEKGLFSPGPERVCAMRRRFAGSAFRLALAS